MASRATDSKDPRRSLRDLIERECGYLISFTKQMKEEIQANRVVQIQEKLDRNRRKLQAHIHWILPANNRSCDVPLSGTERALCVLNGSRPGPADKDFANVHDVAFDKTNLLPFCRGIPKYLTWVFLRRNQRMADDQSVVGRRRIYYDQSGNEALICSDSEDDFPEGEEEKHDFSEAEDRILLETYSRMYSQERILDADVADVVSHSIGATPAEIKERYKELKLKGKEPQESSSEKNMSLEKSLSAVLDSFDNLFCRRCLVFDCRLHGCSQNLVYPSEKQFSLFEPEDGKPCSDQCYLLAGQTSGALVQGLNIRPLHQMDHNAAICVARNLDTDSGEGCSAAFLSASAAVPIAQLENVAKRKLTDDNDGELEASKSFEDSIHKKSLKIQAIEPTTVVAEIVSGSAISSAKIRKLSIETCQSMDTQVACKHPPEGHTTSFLTDVSSQKTSGPQGCEVVGDEVRENNGRPELKQPTVSLGGKNISLSSNCEWKPLEKDLYIKGLEIFGRNSCLIARNLLSGLKTCSEVSCYMHDSRALMAHAMDTVRSEDNARADNDIKEQEVLVRSRSRVVRKKGRSRRFKYSTKSNGQPSSWKSIGDGDQSCKQYTPCDCKFMCGKECSCLKRGTCCEKYCGCSKSCKNRFRGCHCAKSQCRSRQCPCFAANRECDPDVCRNCWVSCGGGPLGEPPKRGDGQCGNMRLLLRQQQRILLGISDVAGWGAFIKNTVNKHDYLGEYTGELISHREADKRGKIYDRANSSFLFDLNDQYVLDACRHGDKLKFANHSSNPNCYCKVMLVAGDHRVGIFAKERIESGDELFYDYRYRPDQAPAWALCPGAPKKDDHLPSQSRARKHQSR